MQRRKVNDYNTRSQKVSDKNPGAMLNKNMSRKLRWCDNVGKQQKNKGQNIFPVETLTLFSSKKNEARMHP